MFISQAVALVIIRYYYIRTLGHTAHRAAAYDTAGQQVWDSGYGSGYGSSGIARRAVRDQLDATGINRAGAALVEHCVATKKQFREPFGSSVTPPGGW